MMNPKPATRPIGFWKRWIYTTDHRTIGIHYLLLSLLAVTAGTLLSIVMRIHMVWPKWILPFWGEILPENYLAVMTLHGTLMIFFVVTLVPQSSFANLVLPEQIGARAMALPRLNAAALWITGLALAILLASILSPGGGPISGWTSYPPLSVFPTAGPGQASGMDFWLISIAVLAIASVMSATNVLSTVITKRCVGMTLGRMPLTVWSWMVTSILVMAAFSVLFVAIVMLLADRHFGASFFVPPVDVIAGQVFHRGNGSPMMWLHLFWFFGHPAIYVGILPGMGLISGVLANFSRTPPLGYRWMVGSTLLIGVLGLVVWGHHMFASGMNPYADTAFALTTMAIAIPSTVKVLSWLGTIWRGKRERTTAMLFALGFVSLFVTGGLTGPVLAQPMLDRYLHNTYFVVAHFHLIMSMAGIFSIYAGIYYWFPLMSGRLMNEALGKWHFWLTLVGAYATFLPMHLVGLFGQPRQYEQLVGDYVLFQNLAPLEKLITCAAIVLAAAQLIFLCNFLWSMKRGASAPINPWRATTLEWKATQEEPIVYCGPYEYGVRGGNMNFRMQCE